MITTSNQPRYWLQVKDEYIVENFDSLVNYLRNYNYDSQQLHPDYDSTLSCMQSLCAMLGEKIRRAPIYRPLELEYDNETILKLLCATILAEKAAGESMHQEVVSLCSLLLHMQVKIDLRVIFDKITACMRNQRIISTGITWDNIAPRDGEFSLNFLVLAFTRMTFEPVVENTPTRYIEHNGTLMIPRTGALNLFVGNKEEYERGKGELQFALQDMVNIYHRSGEISESDNFSSLISAARRMDAEQLKMKPSMRVIQKDYEEDDVFPIKIVTKRGMMMIGRTIDKRYTPIEGKLLIQFYDNRPSTRIFIEMLKEGDTLMVSKSDVDGYTFTTAESFEDFYRHYSSEFADCEVDAIYSGYFSAGTKWISREGIRLSLPRQKVDELDEESRDRLEALISMRGVAAMHLYKNPPQMDSANFNVYCQPEEDIFYDWADEMPAPFTQEDADRAMLATFMEQCSEQMVEMPEQCDYVAGDMELAASYVALFHSMGLLRKDNLRMWFLYDLAAMMISRICDMDSYHDYLEGEIDYMGQLAQFAGGTLPKCPAQLEQAPEGDTLALRRGILKALGGYKSADPAKNVVVGSEEKRLSEEQILANVEALVKASNSLVDIIDVEETDNIKRAIAKLLGAGDEYVSILDNRTFYGKENVALEFKTTAVFPPENLRRDTTRYADPEMQKWVIMKAVCGLLNSRSGGDLLIGVNDAGYAVGLKDDINQLYREGLIYHPDMDHYITYLGNMFDMGFRELGATGSGYDREISRKHIFISEEENSEDRSIIRVHVVPYGKKRVEFAPASWRPDWVANAYVRQNARTIPLV